jgi:hypothetical protein
MEEILKELNIFLNEASLATYAGGGAKLDPEKAEAGMQELEYKDKTGRWHYKDSYAGFFQSWDREVIWFDGKPFWCQIYGGGMKKKFHKDAEFVHKTFSFLKKALSSTKEENIFQPRGPRFFSDGDWKYECKFKGDITGFKGNEKIKFKDKAVFTHEFVGGLFLYKG